MALLRWLALRLALLSSVTWFLPRAVLAAPPATGVADVALDASGMLIGRVFNEHQAFESNHPVAVFRDGNYLGTTSTDEEGRFRFRLERGGVYQVTTAASAQMVRVWTASSAPPSARPEICITTQTTAVRGRFQRRRAVPLVPLGVAATALVLAIVLPLALTDDDPDAS